MLILLVLRNHVRVMLGATCGQKRPHPHNLISSYLWWRLEHSRFWSPAQTGTLKGGKGKRKKEKREKRIRDYHDTNTKPHLWQQQHPKNPRSQQNTSASSTLSPIIF